MAASSDRLNFLRPFVLLSSLGIVLALLYFGRAVLIPLALAVLLTFLLAPVVTFLQRRGLPRAPAVVAVVGVAFVVFAVIGWLVVWQATALVASLPDYQENLDEKIKTVRSLSRGGIIERIEVAVEQIRRRIEEPADPESAAALEALKEIKGAPQPVRIVAEPEEAFDLAAVWSLLGPLLEPIATAALVAVLVIFLLLRREDMRDRLIVLVGRGRLTLTTKALDEAGYRISRYLLMQLILNASFGLSIALGLFVLGVPYAFLWGFLAGVLRYIPYLGPWLAASLPLALAILVTRGWAVPLAVVGLFLVLETINNMFLEPWLYGRNVGVSDAAAIVAVAFWTWLWGPIGLVLAFPLTVCLVVIGRYVPFLRFLDTLLGDGAALAPHAGFYQRLLARDPDEASDIAEEQLKQSSLEAVFDEVLAPALGFARRDLDSDLISEEEHTTMLASISEIAEELAGQSKAAATQVDAQESSSGSPPVRMFACPARDETDEAALKLLARLIDPEKYTVQVLASSLLATEVASMVEQEPVALICIGAVPPGGAAHIRYLCKRLRACCSDAKIVVGRWGMANVSNGKDEPLRAAGADYIVTRLAEARNQILSLAPVIAAQRRQETERLETEATPVG